MTGGRPPRAPLLQAAQHDAAAAGRSGSDCCQPAVGMLDAAAPMLFVCSLEPFCKFAALQTQQALAVAV